MIDYTLFDFAAPPLAGADWFIKAAQLCGLGPGFCHAAHDPFPERRSMNKLRISLVRNPWDWLVSVFLCLNHQAGLSNYIAPISTLDHGSLDSFVWDYLCHHAGCVGKIFDQYRADFSMRVEDLPGAFITLAPSLGIPKSLYNRVSNLPVEQSHYRTNPEIRSMVLDAERSFAERYDYW